MRLLPSFTAASLLVLALSNPALAGGPPATVEPNVTPVPAPSASHVERYGSQILIADLLWMGAVTVVGSSGAGDGDLGAVLSLGYFATGPLVHLKHGNGMGAAKSLGARFLMPVAGMLVGGLIAAGSVDDSNDYEDDDIFDDDDFAVLGGMVIGAMVGVGTAMVLDWTTFSKKTVEDRPATWAVMPNVGVTKHGVAVGLGGHF